MGRRGAVTLGHARGAPYGLPWLGGTIASTVTGTAGPTDLVSLLLPRPGWWWCIGDTQTRRDGAAAHHYLTMTDAANANRLPASLIQIGGTSNTWWTLMHAEAPLYIRESDLRLKLRGQSDTTSTWPAGTASLLAVPAIPAPWPEYHRGRTRGGVPWGLPFKGDYLAADIGSVGPSDVLVASVVAPRPGWYLALGNVQQVRSSGAVQHTYSAFKDSAGNHRGVGYYTQISALSNSQWHLISTHDVFYVSENDLNVRLVTQADSSATAKLGSRLTLIPVLPDFMDGPEAMGHPRGGR